MSFIKFLLSKYIYRMNYLLYTARTLIGVSKIENTLVSEEVNYINYLLKKEGKELC